MATVRPSTIHSFAVSVLLQNPGASNIFEPLRIADQWELKNTITADLKHRLGFSAKKVDSLRSRMAAGWESLIDEDPGPPDSEKSRFISAIQEHRRIFGCLVALVFAKSAGVESRQAYLDGRREKAL